MNQDETAAEGHSHQSPVDVSVVDTTIHAVDRMDNRARVETTGWNEIEPPHEFEQEVDSSIGGRVSELAVAAKFPQLAEVDDDGGVINHLTIQSDDELTLSRSQYRLSVEPPVGINIRFDGAATIEITESDEVVLSFDQPEPVSIGFISLLRYPRHTITVPPTNEGLATALSQFSSAIQTAESVRSSDRNRRHPPGLRFGDEVEIPAAVSDHVLETGLELRLPDRTDVLFQAAPLAFYLGARVALHDGDPVLRSADGEIRYDFDRPPRFQYQVLSLLRRAFFLDLLTHYDHHSDGDPKELDLLSRIELDTETVDSYTPSERLRTYLDVDFDSISPGLPEWHLVSYVEPTFDNARALPHLLRYLSGILSPDEYPARSAVDDTELASVVRDTIPDRVTNPTCHGSSIGWLSSDPRPDDRPFVIDPDGYVNVSRYLDRDETAGSVLVVCNESSKSDRRELVVDFYETHSPDSVTVESRSMVSRNELAALFERGADYLHFIGSVDDGFQCPDGRLRPAAFARSNVRLFFLEGGDSMATATACIEKGSVGGFAFDGDRTLSRSDRETLLGLFMRGFTLEQAYRYATWYADRESDLLVVGDAFQQLVRNMTLYCSPVTIDPQETNRFTVTAYPYIPEAGFIWRPEPVDIQSQLCASPFEFTVAGTELENLIETENMIPIYDDTVHWKQNRDFFYPLL